MTTSTGSSTQQLQHSGSETDLQQVMDVRKRKRMISNRESARRSRLKRQKQVDDLTAKTGQLKDENSQILANMNVTTQLYLNVEAENSVLRAQLEELSNRLQSLNEIADCLSHQGENNNKKGAFGFVVENEFVGSGLSGGDGFSGADELMKMMMMKEMMMMGNDMWDQSLFMNQQPIMACVDGFVC